MPIFPRTVPTLLFAALLTIGLAGCQGCQTTVPQSDNTDPNLKLILMDNTGNLQNITSNTTKTVPKNANMVVFATAEDPEGVQRLSLSLDGAKRCGEGEFVRHYPIGGPGTTEFDIAPPNTGPGDTTVDTRVVAKSVQGQLYYNCPGDRSLVGAGAEYEARAENFHGGVATSPTLTLTAP